MSLHLDHFVGYSDLHLVVKLRMHSILLHHFVLVPLLIHIALMCSMLEACVVSCIGHTGIEPSEQNCKCSTPWILYYDSLPHITCALTHWKSSLVAFEKNFLDSNTKLCMVPFLPTSSFPLFIICPLFCTAL